MTTPCTILRLVNGEVTGRVTGVNLELGIVLKHHGLNGHESEQTLGDSEGHGNLVCCSPWGCKESDTTVQLNNNLLYICMGQFER